MSTQEERDWHPIRDVIARLIEDGDEGQEPARFPRDGLTKLATLVDEFLATPELFDVVDTILVISHVLETEQSSPTAARQLVAIVDQEHVLDAMKAFNREKDGERADTVSARSDQLKQLEGKSTVKTAPKSGEDAPEGSIKLGNLDFPKRM